MSANRMAIVGQSVSKIDSSQARRAQLAEDFLFLLYKVIYSGRGAGVSRSAQHGCVRL